MSVTLAAPVGATDSILSLSAPVEGCVPGNFLRLDSELVEVGGHPHIRGEKNDHYLVSVKRGRAGTSRAPHAAGTVVMGVSDAFVSSSDENMPPPIVENGGGGAHPNLATHEALGLVTDADLTAHEGTAHGTQAHAISGVSHTGSLDHSALGSVTANQHHNQAHALGGGDHTGSLAQSSVTNLTTDLAGKAATSHNHAGEDITSGTVADARVASTLARDSEVTSAIGTHEAASDPHTGYVREADANWTDLTDGGATTLHSHTGGAGVSLNDVIDALYPVGALYVSTLTTNPGTLLGRGTWTAFGAGRVLVGRDSGDADFDTAEETGGSKTVTLTSAEMPSHTHTQDSHNHTQNAHVHDEFNNSATTGGLVGWGAQDTSTNTASLTGYDTGSTTATNIATTATNQNTGGGGAHQNMPPYIVVYMWKRTA